MTLIEKWKHRQLNSLEPFRVIATTEARCNLACAHCYWSHEMQFKPIDDWNSVISRLVNLNTPLFFAGRILTNNGAGFLDLCIQNHACPEIGIVDNGFTILKFPHLLPHYKTINISIDGWQEEHDRQRGRIGAFDTAWGTVLELKRQGFDPVISSAISPLTTHKWERFEGLLADHDVPMSSTLVWALPNPAERNTTIFQNDREMCEAFEKLMRGIPKLINLYSFEQVKVLWPILSHLKWEIDTDVGDCLSAELSTGTILIYRPSSLTSVAERSLEWDGVFYTPFTYGMKLPIDMVEESYFKWVQIQNMRELDLWSEVF